MRMIALAAALFLLAVSASWGSAGAASGSPTLNGGAHAIKGPTGATGPTGRLSHVKTRWRATLATLPANAATGENQAVSISSISCASRGHCTAVGSYYGNAGDQEGLLLTEKAGHWATGVEAVLPANADSDPQVSLTSVSCASAGNCAAVGTYSDNSGGIYTEGGHPGLLLTEKAGHWAPGVEAVLPASTPSYTVAALESVSCASAGNCTAVGNAGYSPYDPDATGLLLTENAGHWKRGVAYGDPGADVSSVSCSSGGGCSAVGYQDYAPPPDRDSGPLGDPLLLAKKGGKWRTGDPAIGADGPTFMTSVSCASAGNCSAIGLHYPPLYGIDVEADPGGVLLTERAGRWGRVVTASVGGLVGISCGSPGDCVAIGDGLTLLTEKAGKWKGGVEAALPRGAHDPKGAAISCASPGNCTAVGSYAGRHHGLLLTEIAGRWARGVRPPHLPNSFDSVSSVSCASPGHCGAVGVSWTSGGPVYGVLLDSTTEPCVVPRLRGKTLFRARHSIESHNCSVGTIEHARLATIEAGHVISQAPQPGRHVAPGTKVDLTVSSGP